MKKILAILIMLCICFTYGIVEAKQCNANYKYTLILQLEKVPLSQWKIDYVLNSITFIKKGVEIKINHLGWLSINGQEIKLWSVMIEKTKRLYETIYNNSILPETLELQKALKIWFNFSKTGDCTLKEKK